MSEEKTDECDKELLIRRKIREGIFYYSGFEYIYRKIKPTEEPRPLPTWSLWFIGVYIAFFGLASQRYENKIDIVEIRANSIFA